MGRPATRRWPGALLGLLMVFPVAGQDAQAVERAEDQAFVQELRRAFRRGGSFAAQRDLREYLEEFPGSLEARRLAAEVAFGHGRMDVAEQHLQAAGWPDPWLLGRLLLRTGRAPEALQLARGGSLEPLAAAVLEVRALDASGHRAEARRRARAVTDVADRRELGGRDMLQLGRLLSFQRRFELANQALVFADADLNGRRGPAYRLVEPDVLVELGEVYGATRQDGRGAADPALSVLNEVLELDPGHPDALTAKARVYLYGMNGRAAERAWERALARDPSHPGALVLMGTARLLDRRVQAALQAADRVLRVAPRQREALALRAAARFVSGQTEQARAERERFAEVHPDSGALDLLLGRVLQSHYRFADSIAPLERALALEPENENPLWVLAQSLAHVGREAEARVALEEHARRSPWPFPWRANMLDVLERLEDSVETVTEAGFRLRLPSGEQDVTGPLLADALARARADMARRWGYEPTGEVLVEVFDHHADFSVRTVGFSGFMALGACFGEVMTLLSPLSEMRGRFHWAQTAVHEYAHVVTLGLSANRVPRWLTEGVSVVEEKRLHPAWARELEREVLQARFNGAILPVERLDEAFRDGSTVSLGYYQGSLLCELIERDFGFDALRDLVAAHADDRGTVAAIRSVLRVQPEVLDARLLDYIDEVIAARAAVRPRYDEAGKDRRRRRAAEGDATALPELAWAYLDLGRRLDARAALRRARAAAPDEPALLRVEGEMELAEGRRKEAAHLLQRWWEAGGSDADGLRLLSDLLRQQGEPERAAEALQASVLAYEGDTAPGGAPRRLLRGLDRDEQPQAWRAAAQRVCDHDETERALRVSLGRWLWERGEREAGLQRLEEAVALDPYRPDLRLELAEHLVEQGRRPDARAQWSLILGTRAGQLPEQASGDLPEMQEQARKRLQEPVSDGS